jgi:23S rRNA-/tRNA-specific pseudouridylate synthase
MGHAAAGGFPLLGDLKYDGKTTLLIKDEVIGFPRFCLHAFELQLPFGIFRAELPEDLTLLKGKLFT